MVAKKRRLMRVGGLQTQRAYVSAVRAQSGGGEDPVIPLPGLQNAQSQVAIPLVTEDQLIGVFSVESPKPSVFDEKDEVLMGILASQAAGAIRNARLYREVQELNETLEERVRERTEDLRRTQAQLVQSEKMASLGMLVAGIAHEINTPLGSLHSTHDTLFRAADKLRELVEHELPEEARANPRLKTLFGVMSDARDVVRTSTGRVDGIVKRLKSFARLDEAELKEIDLHECIEDTLVLLHHELEGTRLVKSYAELPRITCFPGQLNQVLLNVILNARQAIAEGGEITVTTTREGDRARIDIRDDGVGIAPEALGRVFDPGYTTKGVGVGTGLGLAIAYRIVRDHRGDIRIASEPGKGTTVTITLPFVSFGGSAPEPRELAPAE